MNCGHRRWLLHYKQEEKSMEKQLSFTVCFLRMVGNLTTWAENILHWLPIKVFFLMFTFYQGHQPTKYLLLV